MLRQEEPKQDRLKQEDLKQDGMRLDGLILAGGKSTRMGGTHKGSLLIEAETFTERLVKELKKDAGKVWLSYGGQVHERYEGCGIVRDIYPECGPIGGLHAGLAACTGDGVMAAACDMPFLKIELYRYLARRMEEEEQKTGESLDGVVPVLNCRAKLPEERMDIQQGVRSCLNCPADRSESVGKVNPLAAIYRKSAAALLEEQIRNKEYRIRSALQKLKILYLDLDEGSELGQMLRNINTISEYQMMYRERE